MAKEQSIQHILVQKDILSKEQKRFNNYIKKIKKLKEDIELQKIRNQWLMEKGTKIIVPEIQKSGELEKELIFVLDKTPFRSKLSKKLQQKLDDIIIEMARSVIDERYVPTSEDIVAIYERYSGRSYEEEQKEAAQEAKEQMADFVKQMFDIDIEEEDLDNLGTLQEKVQAQMEEKMAQEEARKQKRKKTAKQAAAEAAREELEKNLSLSTKQIYRQLVKEFHPDKATDAEDEARRTEILQNLNNAYQADDLLTLLEMQISLIQDKQYSLAALPDDTLKLYNTTLQKQAEELKMQFMQVSPEYSGNPFAEYVRTTDESTLRAMKQEAKDIQERQRQLKNTVHSIEDVRELKGFINNFEIEADFDLSDIMHLFR